jgi:thiamine biosynthesis lipoprotein
VGSTARSRHWPISRRDGAGSSPTATWPGSTPPVRVAPETVQIVARAVWLTHRTGGCFDPTVLRALEACGYDETFSVVRARRGEPTRSFVSAPPRQPPLRFAALPVARPVPGVAGVEIDRAGGTIAVPHGVTLDLGGIGKGCAADRLVRRLLADGADAACVGIGGDVACGGAGPIDGSWDIEVEDPFVDDRTWFVARLRAGGIVTSTRRVRRWRHEGRWQHHIIDPRTGAPSASAVEAVVVADRVAWRAEGLAKAALVAGMEQGRALLDRFRVAGWLLDEEPRVAETANAADVVARVAA